MPCFRGDREMDLGNAEKNMKKWILAAALVGLGALAALGGPKKEQWQAVADVTAGGDAKELAVNRVIRVIQIECTQGTVIVNTLWVREGAAKSPVTVARRFSAGETQDIDLGNARQVTGLRISDGGRGAYKIRAK